MPIKLHVQLPDFLEEGDGEIRVKGHRITLYHVLTAFNEGRSAEDDLHDPQGARGSGAPAGGPWHSRAVHAG